MEWACVFPRQSLQHIARQTQELQLQETEEASEVEPMAQNHYDSDSQKGAVESESPLDRSRGQLKNQLPHRSADPLIKDKDEDNDTDYPEPGRVPEHSGQHE
jgi:hypothetical protein